MAGFSILIDLSVPKCGHKSAKDFIAGINRQPVGDFQQQSQRTTAFVIQRENLFAPISDFVVKLSY
ncbi:MAG: hypothetical protein NT121_02610 [Chloroflexi bacterium]|nr:hypothetical protein [Chloroflexota bacterium]